MNSIFRPLALFLWVPFTTSCAGDDESACPKPEDSFVRSTDLGSLNDSSEAPLKSSGELSECNDEDFFHYRAYDDDWLDRNRPAIELRYESEAKIEACVYVACDEGATVLEDCEVDEERFFPIESQLGFRGCCRVGAGRIDVEYTCDNGLSEAVSKDTADFYVHVCSLEVAEATSYRLSAEF